MLDHYTRVEQPFLHRRKIPCRREQWLFVAAERPPVRAETQAHFNEISRRALNIRKAATRALCNRVAEHLARIKPGCYIGIRSQPRTSLRAEQHENGDRGLAGEAESPAEIPQAESIRRGAESPQRKCCEEVPQGAQRRAYRVRANPH